MRKLFVLSFFAMALIVAPNIARAACSSGSYPIGRTDGFGTTVCKTCPDNGNCSTGNLTCINNTYLVGVYDSGVGQENARLKYECRACPNNATSCSGRSSETVPVSSVTCKDGYYPAYKATDATGASSASDLVIGSNNVTRFVVCLACPSGRGYSTCNTNGITCDINNKYALVNVRRSSCDNYIVQRCIKCPEADNGAQPGERNMQLQKYSYLSECWMYGGLESTGSDENGSYKMVPDSSTMCLLGDFNNDSHQLDEFNDALKKDSDTDVYVCNGVSTVTGTSGSYDEFCTNSCDDRQSD